VKGSRYLLLEFWDPLHISGTVQARNIIIWHADWPRGVPTRENKN